MAQSPLSTPARPVPHNDAPSSTAPPVPNDTALTVAAVIYFLMSALLILIALLQVVLSLVIAGVINLVIGILFAFVGWWILQRNSRGYDWGLWSALLNAAWGIYLAFTTPSPLMVLVPFCVIAALLLWNNRRAFSN